MFEEFLSDLGKAFALGLVTAAAFVAAFVAMRGQHSGRFTSIYAPPGGGPDKIVYVLNVGLWQSLAWMLLAIRV